MFRTFYLPLSWADPLIRDDHSKLTPAEADALQAFKEAHTSHEMFHCVSAGAYDGETSMHDAKRFGIGYTACAYFQFQTALGGES